MPIYEYRCRACGDTFEELRPAADADAPVDCACGEADVARLPSLIASGHVGGELPLAGGHGGGHGHGGGGCACGGSCGC